MKIAAFILYTGQDTLPNARGSLLTQLADVRVVSHVRPVNKAIQSVFDDAVRDGLDYFLIIGADTVHYHGSVMKLVRAMKQEYWSVFGKLDDFFRGVGPYGNHLYNTEAIKGYQVSDSPMYDHEIHKHMEDAGYTKKLTDEVIGRHHPVWTPQEAFEKYLFSGRRYEKKDLEKIEKELKRALGKRPCDVTRAALEGFHTGVATRHKLAPLTHEPTLEWDIVKDRYTNEKMTW